MRQLRKPSNFSSPAQSLVNFTWFVGLLAHLLLHPVVVFMLKSLADKACNLLSDSNSEGKSLKMSKSEELFGAKFRRTSHYGSTRVGTRGS